MSEFVREYTEPNELSDTAHMLTYWKGVIDAAKKQIDYACQQRDALIDKLSKIALRVELDDD